MLANNVKQKEVVGVRILFVRPGPNPWYPWDPGYPGEPGPPPPDCEWGCDDNGGGGGAALSQLPIQQTLLFLKWWRKNHCSI